MKREEIEVLPDVRPFCFENGREETWYNVGLIDGLETADNEPQTDELWHNVYDIPNKNRTILCSQVNGSGYSLHVIIDGCEDWESFVQKHQLFIWAYVDDLLPKEKK